MFLVDNLSRKVDFMQAQPNLSVCLSLNVCVRGKSFDVKNLIRPFQNVSKIEIYLVNKMRCYIENNLGREVLRKGKSHYGRPPCTN